MGEQKSERNSSSVEGFATLRGSKSALMDVGWWMVEWCFVVVLCLCVCGLPSNCKGGDC